MKKQISVKKLGKRMGVLLVTLLLAVSFSGCQRQPSHWSGPSRCHHYLDFPLWESVELTWWYNGRDAYTDAFVDLSEHPFFKRMEEETNVFVEITKPDPQNAKAEFYTLMASGYYPDMFTPGDALPALGGASVGTLDDLADEEYALVLSEYAMVQAGSLERLREEYMWLDQTIVTPCDNMMYLPNISRLIHPSEEKEEGLVIRGDLLDQLQMDVPETMKDWERVLAGFVDLGVETPLALGDEAVMASNVFLSSYGVARDFYLNEEGEVSSGATSEGLRAYVEDMSRWVEMGLADFVVPTEEQKTAPLEVGAWYATADELELLNRQAGQGAVSGTYRLVGAPDPVKQKGDVIALREKDPLVGTYKDGILVTLNELPAVVCAWVDHVFYEEESMELNAYGLVPEGLEFSGKHYAVDEEGRFDGFLFNVTEEAVKNNCLFFGLCYDPAVKKEYCYGKETKAAMERWSRATSQQGLYPMEFMMNRLTEEELKWAKENDLSLLHRPGINGQKTQLKQLIQSGYTQEGWQDYVTRMESNGRKQRMTEIMQEAWNRLKEKEE